MAALKQRTTTTQSPGETPKAAKVVQIDGKPEEPIPFTPPNFTIKELLGAIPSHCFHRSVWRSSAYVLWDFALIALFGYAASHINTYLDQDGLWLDGLAGKAAKAAAWATYWWFQGLVFTGVWVLAHECGHQAFSESKAINNGVGWVLHSALLVPYHSWRITHGQHHAATSHMTRDQVHVPKTASDLGIKTPENESWLDTADDLLEDAPIYALVNLLAQQIFGWWMYLIRNASGQRSYPRFTNHFSPNSVMFKKREFWQIVQSDVGIALVFAGLTMWSRATSFWNVVCYYGIPYMLCNHWLVLITFLQHTHESLPHYRASQWNFQRGALCTMDRHVFDFFTHDIASTHVTHHLCSSIPHYHAHEATEALKPVLGEHYRYSPENWLTSTWKTYRQCRFVDDDGEVVFFRDARGKATHKVSYEPTDSGVEL